ncbi:MAG: DNA replication protein [Anaerolineae bacterium]|nr:MAG: DNA replication protein [Anaerolineae bacterium]
MQPINYTRIRQRLVSLPDNSQCRTCGFWDVRDPEVQRRMNEAGRMLYEARCRCPSPAARQRTAARHIGWANLPHQGLMHRTFSNFMPRRGTAAALSAAQAFVAGAPWNILVLVGPTGVGKSHLLEAIGRACLDAGVQVRYEQVAEFINRYRAANSEDAEQTVWALTEWYRTFPVILLDDLGLERPTGYAAERIVALVEDRLASGQRLACATNLSQDEVRQSYGPRLASRLWDQSTGQVHTVTIAAEDYRTERSLRRSKTAPKQRTEA